MLRITNKLRTISTFYRRRQLAVRDSLSTIEGCCDKLRLTTDSLIGTSPASPTTQFQKKKVTTNLTNLTNKIRQETEVMHSYRIPISLLERALRIILCSFFMILIRVIREIRGLNSVAFMKTFLLSPNSSGRISRFRITSSRNDRSTLQSVPQFFRGIESGSNGCMCREMRS